MRLIAEIEGDLTIWESEGGFASSSVEIGAVDFEAWLAKSLGLPVTDRGNVAQGAYGRIIIKLFRVTD